MRTLYTMYLPEGPKESMSIRMRNLFHTVEQNLTLFISGFVCLVVLLKIAILTLSA